MSEKSKKVWLCVAAVLGFGSSIVTALLTPDTKKLESKIDTMENEIKLLKEKN